MKEKGALSFRLGLVIVVGIIAIAVMLGATLFDIDSVRVLALAVLLLAIALVVP